LIFSVDDAYVDGHYRDVVRGGGHDRDDDRDCDDRDCDDRGYRNLNQG
jgi:hypothetical protein